jgi:hypothetical protein
VVDFFGPAFGFGDPEVARCEATLVVEEDFVKEAMDWRHPFFVRDGGNIGDVDAEVSGDIDLDLDAGGKNVPPNEGVDRMAMLIDEERAGGVLRAGKEGLERRERVMGFVDEQGALNFPEGRGVVVVVVAELIAIFEDAADFDAGEVDDSAGDPIASGFHDEQVFDFAFEWSYRSIGVDGSGLDIGDLVVAPGVGHIDSGVLFAFFGEDFDACVDHVVVKRIVGDFFDVEVNGGGTRGLGVGGHFELVGGGGLELGEQAGWRCKGEEQESGCRDAILAQGLADKGGERAHDG